jgi:hypothetical protein
MTKYRHYSLTNIFFDILPTFISFSFLSFFFLLDSLVFFGVCMYVLSRVSVFFFILFSHSESSIEEEEEKSGNRSRHMVNKVEDEEQQKQLQTNSPISSSSASGPSKYFASSSQQKILSKKSTETVGVGKIYYTALRTNDGCSSRNRTSSMNILHSNIDERTMRRKTKIRKKSAYRTRKLVKKEREKRLINVYNNYEGRKKDKEIKSSLFYETNHIL